MMAVSQNSSLSALGALADPPTRYIDAAAMDYLLIEMVATLRESAAVATTRQKKIEQEMAEAGLLPPPVPVPTALKRETARDSMTSVVSRTGSASGKAAVDEEEEPVRQRLESIGMHVGSNFTERSVFRSVRILISDMPYYRLCKDKNIFADTLDAIKFICKDVWAACWDKQIDNLRTNHRVCTKYYVLSTSENTEKSGYLCPSRQHI
jgi:hypothetical protein